MRLPFGAERRAAIAYFCGACADDDRCGYAAGNEERANFSRVLWFLVQRSAFGWVYELTAAADSAAWRLGVYEGRCLGAICCDVPACHVRPACLAPQFAELSPQSAPWLRSVVRAPKATGRPKEKQLRKANDVPISRPQGRSVARGDAADEVRSEAGVGSAAVVAASSWPAAPYKGSSCRFGSYCFDTNFAIDFETKRLFAQRCLLWKLRPSLHNRISKAPCFVLREWCAMHPATCRMKMVETLASKWS